MYNGLFALDRLYDAVAERGNVCIGLDTAVEYLPERALAEAASEADALFAYNRAVIDATYDVAACYKVQIAYYEALGRAGMNAYAKTLRALRDKNCLSIADVKRGDIADTAARYARAHFCGDFEADIVTLSPYMGMDSLEPWMQAAEERGKGAFVLLRTSNAGFQDFEGLAVSGGTAVYDVVGEKLLALAAAHAGKRGFGIFGAVVGAAAKTAGEKEAAVRLREKYARLFFLIPGYGAQGGGAAEAAVLLGNDKKGGVVNASRSILKAWQNTKEGARVTLEEAAGAARDAAIAMRDALRLA